MLSSYKASMWTLWRASELPAKAKPLQIEINELPIERMVNLCNQLGRLMLQGFEDEEQDEQMPFWVPGCAFCWLAEDPCIMASRGTS